MPNARRSITLASIAVLTLTASAVGAVAHGAETQRPSPSQVAAAVCEQRGAIPAQRLAKPVATAGKCRLDGRLVTTAEGVGAPVPEPGYTNKVHVLTTDGGVDLSVSNSDRGIVRATVERAAATGATAQTDILDPCTQTEWAAYGSWPTTLQWWYNSATASRAGLPASGTLSAMRSGNQHITLGHNDCGLPQKQFSARGAYQGNTSLYANVNSNGQCTNKFPSGQNAVSWGPTASGMDFLAVTCSAVYEATGEIAEADIYLSSNRGLVLNFPSPCVDRYDTESIITHEWGHAFGLDHVSEAASPDLTMSPIAPDCDSGPRSLGLGDWDGMDALY